MLQIRLATEGDLPELDRVFAAARRFMREVGNPTQWGTSYPERKILLRDLEREQLYAVEQDGRICGAFVYALGDEPTYQIIENGAWLDDAPYGTIHRIASDGTVHGLFPVVLAFCQDIQPNVRIDTHADNAPMLRCIQKAGFTWCGIIYHTDGTPREAFQLPPARG